MITRPPPCTPQGDAVDCAVEIGKIATRDKADPYPIDQSESVLRPFATKKAEKFKLK